MEKWKDIIGYENLYQISNFGRVKRLEKTIIDSKGRKYFYKENILAGDNSKSEYRKVVLTKNRKNRTFRIHRLVAQGFILNPKGKKEVNHLDGNKLNNRADNLEWATGEENSQHAARIGLIHQKGSKNNFSKLIESDVKRIYSMARSKLLTQSEIAGKFNISRTTVSDIKNGRRWSHFTKNL